MPSCVPWDLDSSCCDEWAALPEAQQERAAELAWSTLRTLSGGQIGTCPVIVRPCLGPPCDVCNSWWLDRLAAPRPWIGVGMDSGNWVNCACGRPGCSCSPLCEIVMPGPIAALVAVELDGVELALEDFRVDNGHRIVRMDGECWPSCQDLGRALGEPGTLGITYVPGIRPDAAALSAAGILACEFAKACAGGKCRLPASVTTIARQGVAMSFSTGMFADGLTGIREVDAYLVSINPHTLRTPPMVWSPDVSWAKHRYETPTVMVVP